MSLQRLLRADEQKSRATTGNKRGREGHGEEDVGGESGNNKRQKEESNGGNGGSINNVVMEAKRSVVIVLVRDVEDPEFCVVCQATQDPKSFRYLVTYPDGKEDELPSHHVFPMVDAKTACDDSATAGDVGRKIAVFYPPEDTWYCGKIEGWRGTKIGEAPSSVGIHAVRYEVNDEMEDIRLEREKFVWMTKRTSAQREPRGWRGGGISGGRTEGKRNKLNGGGNAAGGTVSRGGAASLNSSSSPSSSSSSSSSSPSSITITTSSSSFTGVEL